MRVVGGSGRNKKGYKSDVVEPNGIVLCPVNNDDESFIFSIFASSRPDLEWMTGLGEVMKAELIRQQFMCEQEYLKREYPDAALSIVLLEGEPIGRLYVHRGAKTFRVIAIALLPEYRGRGIGKDLLSGILKEASEAGKQVRLKVAWFNYSARSLYERLGFSTIEDTGVYCEMQWAPESHL